MPIYDLRCPDCGHEFDELVASHDAISAVTCGMCDRTGMEQKPSLFASSVSVGSGGGCGHGGFT